MSTYCILTSSSWMVPVPAHICILMQYAGSAIQRAEIYNRQDVPTWAVAIWAAKQLVFTQNEVHGLGSSLHLPFHSSVFLTGNCSTNSQRNFDQRRWVRCQHCYFCGKNTLPGVQLLHGVRADNHLRPRLPHPIAPLPLVPSFGQRRLKWGHMKRQI